ncbi:MAG: sensor histidine kinase, partial [Longicatena sp.]
MKRFNEFIKQLSLTQQLFALIFFFVTFFTVFFFVYVNGNVNTAIQDQIYNQLDSTQNSLIASSQEATESEASWYVSVSGFDSLTARVVQVNDQTKIVIDPSAASEMDVVTNSKEWTAIANSAVL